MKKAADLLTGTDSSEGLLTLGYSAEALKQRTRWVYQQLDSLHPADGNDRYIIRLGQTRKECVNFI